MLDLTINNENDGMVMILRDIHDVAESPAVYLILQWGAGNSAGIHLSRDNTSIVQSWINDWTTQHNPKPPVTYDTVEELLQYIIEEREGMLRDNEDILNRNKKVEGTAVPIQTNIQQDATVRQCRIDLYNAKINLITYREKRDKEVNTNKPKESSG